MNETIAAMRGLGVQIVWAPSDVLDFYKETPQRRAMLAVPNHPEPARIGFNPPQVPQGDNCECGPARPCRPRKAWSRQHAGLRIAETDLIADCNNGRELLNLCAEREIDTLIYMGVASNMCVCYRSMGMVNMRDYGLRTVFVSDLVQAIMGNGFNPATGKEDPNFTPAKGSRIVQIALERHVAGSIESGQLLALAGREKARPHIVFVLADEEYGTGETLPAWAAERLGSKFRCTFLHASRTNRNDVPGLEALYDADLLVLSMRRRFLPAAQMDHLEGFIRSGRPLIVLRVGVAPFAEGAGLRREAAGSVVWQNFDWEVLGCRYDFYDPAARETGSDIRSPASAAGHPILKDLAPVTFHSSAWIYRVRPLAEGSTVLLEGSWPASRDDQPVAWVREREGSRVFYTSLGHPDDFKVAVFRDLLAKAVDWSLGFASD